jgi:hypothetical protein
MFNINFVRIFGIFWRNQQSSTKWAQATEERKTKLGRRNGRLAKLDIHLCIRAGRIL